MKFHFRARTRAGKVATGTLEAPTAEQARKQLAHSYPTILSITPIRAGPTRPLRVHKISHDDLALFYRRFATLLTSGITIDSALDSLSRSESGELGSVLERVLHSVLSGRTLSQSMANPELAGLFPPLSVGMIAVGERTGALTEAATRLADLTERQFRLRRSIYAALTYPAVLLLAILSVGGLFVIVIAPGDQGLFATFGGRLPWPSQVLVDLSHALRSPLCWLTVLLVLPASAFMFRHALRRSDPFREAVDAWLWKAPLLGDIVRKGLSARVVSVLGAALRVGIPALESLALARQVATNRVLERGIATATEEFRGGLDLATALERQKVFPRVITALMAVGQETGTLDTLLYRACLLFEEDVETALNRFTKVLEPILLAVAGVGATFVALATLLPVMEIAGHI